VSRALSPGPGLARARLGLRPRLHESRGLIFMPGLLRRAGACKGLIAYQITSKCWPKALLKSIQHTCTLLHKYHGNGEFESSQAKAKTRKFGALILMVVQGAALVSIDCQ
jgi:hypothetical protein